MSPYSRLYYPKDRQQGGPQGGRARPGQWEQQSYREDRLVLVLLHQTLPWYRVRALATVID